VDEEKEEEVIAKCKLIKKKDGSIGATCAVTGLKEDEESPGCAEAIAVGWALNYIKALESEEAEKLHAQVLAEEITADQALDRCEQIAKEHKDQTLADTIVYLKEIAHKPLSELQKDIGNNERKKRKG